MTQVITNVMVVITGVIVGVILFRIESRDKKDEVREAERAKKDFLLLKNVKAIGGVAEKIAVCVKNGQVNGDMDDALKYHMAQKHELEDFLDKQATKYSY